MDYLGTTEKPLTHIGKLLQFEARTTDPESTEEGDLWLRVDLAEEDHQLATFRFDAGTEIWDIPVLEAGSSHADVEEVLPVDIGGQRGYVPVADRAEVAYPQLGFRHDGTTLGLHDFSDLFEPTYFEVRDINAPAEVDPEETFTTTAIIDNTNGRLDTQTIEHEFDNAVVNTEAVELEDDTYQVSFEYSHTEEGSFTNAIYSEDDFDSMDVQVGDAIPDSAVSQYRVAEGSGTTLNNEFSGQPDAAITGASWLSDSNLEGGFGLNHDGIDDRTDIDSQYSFVGDGEQFSFCCTVNFNDITVSDGGEGQIIWAQSNGSWAVSTGVTLNGGELGVGLLDSGGSVVDETSTTNVSSTRLRVGFKIDFVNDTSAVFVNGVDETNSTNRPSLRRSESHNTMGNYYSANPSEADGAANVVIDNPIWYKNLLTNDEFSDDYTSQPWA